MTTTNEPAAEEPWAAMRDASWYARPNVHTAKVIHVSGRTAREGILSRCGRSVLNRDLTWTLADAPEHARCRSNGCRQAWPTVTAPADGSTR